MSAATSKDMPKDMSKDEQRARRALGRCRRIVIKIGSKALTRDPDMFQRLADDLTGARGAGGQGKRGPHRRMVLVSSGAIALGMGPLSLARRPRQMAMLQAAAATGQSLLMQRYGDAFGVHGWPVAQVLLSHADLASRVRANNARAALDKLLELGVLPIINENDAVATDEIRFGDNDELASLVTPLCDGELLLLLSSVNGVLDEHGERIPFAASVSAQHLGLVTGSVSDVGTGGMQSKLISARSATLAGAHVVIASADEPQVVERVLAGEPLGTLFPAIAERLTTRKHWIAYALRPRGAAVIDDGAIEAITARGRSLLCVGVVGVRGAFVGGDPIALVDLRGREIARGLARVSSSEAARLAAAPRPLGSELLVHRDDLVLLPQLPLT
jgi:glutamate 5-kinase